MSSLKHRLKTLARCIAPDLTLVLLSIRSRRMIERQTSRLGLDALAREIAGGAGGEVMTGPFRGMRLEPRALQVHVAPKLLGTYESELHEALEVMVARTPRRVINVGTAEGYYAVGLARRLPFAEVYGFDADPKARRATLLNARINGVEDQLQIGGILHPARMETLLSIGHCLVVMDVEGAEVDLLEPASIRSLAYADIVVELHPSMRRGADAGLAERFVASHDVRLIEQSSIEAKRALVGHLKIVELARAVDERRGDNAWLVMVAKRRDALPN